MNETLPLLARLALVLLAIIVGIVIVVVVRRWAQREDRVDTFTFQDLRDMRARGEINEREFQAMRTALLLQMGTNVGPDDSAGSPESGSEPSDSSS